MHVEVVSRLILLNSDSTPRPSYDLYLILNASSGLAATFLTHVPFHMCIRSWPTSRVQYHRQCRSIGLARGQRQLSRQARIRYAVQRDMQVRLHPARWHHQHFPLHVWRSLLSTKHHLRWYVHLNDISLYLRFIFMGGLMSSYFWVNSQPRTHGSSSCLVAVSGMYTEKRGMGYELPPGSTPHIE